MDFNIQNIWTFEVGGVEVWITRTIVNTWIIMALLILFALVVRVKLGGFTEVPGKFQNVIEAMIEAFDGFVRGTAGDKVSYIGGWFFTVFSFILVSNLSGMFGVRPPTADWATTFALAFATFMLIHVLGIRHRGAGGYFKSLCEPMLPFLPLNIIGELARPVSLSFRLFGNILASLILMSMLYSLAPVFLLFVIPIPLHGFFDLFAGVLQTFIFCILSMTFIGIAATGEM
ncbi:MAG: F0F1 ATP synthase subunit A [Oscillospiraceae bacterium]|nr:F0F1 ATP synthase subunit A [Oscillospiraceae bacterium]